MRILTVRQPWAWVIIHGGKDVENRVRNIAGDYRGPVAIHAGLSYDHTSHVISPTLREAQDKAAVAAGAEVYPGGYLWDIGQPDPRAAWSTAGAIIGVVDLVDVHRVIDVGARAHCETVTAPTNPAVSGACSPWADQNAYHLVLANPRALAEPIPFKGALGLRRLDDETIARIEEAIA